MLSLAFALIALIGLVYAVIANLSRARAELERDTALAVVSACTSREAAALKHLRELARETGHRLEMRGGAVIGVMQTRAARVEGDARALLKR